MATGTPFVLSHSVGYLVQCEAHGLHRNVATEAHANNLLAKHLREQHDTTDAWPDLNLSAVCTLVLMAASIEGTTVEQPGDGTTAVLGMWEALTGLPRYEAVMLAQRIQASAEPITAAVAPF